MASTPSEPFGTVVSDIGVKVREFPSTTSSQIGVLPSGFKVGLQCKVRAENIDGNDIWYLLRDRPGWVAARFVANTGNVKFAGDIASGGSASTEDASG
ncbi:SH3 domain-containing protein [Kitasatospora camelliae]|uniref:SH3 domain-containing protein n=1 Tax=Kitasatospora camelliae TaxID=3156397 RepID=A0AAU8JPF5_9ACTN